MTDDQATLLAAADEKIRQLVKRVDPKDLSLHNAGYDPGGELFDQVVTPERERVSLMS